ncbi:MAG: HTH domain-containing protein [Bacteroidales bacterium]|nr:HTH domain-containing protein [Bacteroidales bacterium]
MFFKHLNRLQQLDQLIRQQNTGNAEILAGKMDISRRQVYNFLSELRDLGLEVEYRRDLNSFAYTKPYRINFKIDIRELSPEEILNLEGTAGKQRTRLLVG